MNNGKDPVEVIKSGVYLCRENLKLHLSKKTDMEKGESPKKVYGVGLIGFAHVHALEYAKAFKEGPGTRLVAVADSNVERGKEGASALNMKEFYSDPYEMLKRDDIDIVCITCETARHAEYAIAAAEAGKHICMEKVLDVTLERADKIIRAAEKAGVKLICPPFPHDFNPLLQKIRMIIEDGYIGKPNLAHWHIGHGGVSQRWSEWFYDPKEAGGGALIDLGVHPIYQALYLFGEAQEVIGTMANVYPERIVGSKRITNIQTEDNAVTIIKFKNGVISISDVSFARIRDMSNNAIYGSEGTIIFGNPFVPLTVYSTKTPIDWRGWNIPETAGVTLPGPSKEATMLRFLNLIEREEGTWRVNGKWARDVLEIVLASYKSAKTKKAVTLPLV